MKIDLRKLETHISFSGTADLSNEEIYGTYPFQSPVVYTGDVIDHLGVLRLKGEINATYYTQCARCLKELEIPISAAVDVLLSRDLTAEEEEEVFPLEGNVLEVEDVLIPALLLQVDMIYLCKEDCKGLCPSCGCDRNVSVCHCNAESVDPRFAVLAQLLTDKQD